MAQGTVARPRGREEVTSAIIAACETMCRTRSPSEFTIKELAAEAGITTSLLYFYFDSKDHILSETLRSIAGEINEEALAQPTPRAMIETAAERMWEREGFPRLITALTLEHRNITQLMGGHPFIRTLAAAIDDAYDVPDAQQAAVVLITVAIAASVLGRSANVAIGRDRDDRRVGRDLVEAALRQIEDA